MEIPSVEILQIFRNLKVLDLSHNSIVDVNAKNLIVGCPQLMNLQLSHNKINQIERVRELGKLESLVELDISFNPVCQKLNRLNLLKKLMIIGDYPRINVVSAFKSFYQSNISK